MSNNESSLKFLIVGNSFGDDTVEHIPEIAKSAGFTDIKIANLFVPGCSLETHYNNMIGNKAEYLFRYNDGNGWQYEYGNKQQTLEFGINFADWDVIVFQQASGFSGLKDSYSYLSDVIVGLTKELKPSVRRAFNMTWAYQGDSTHGHFVNYDKNQQTMYNAIISAVKDMVESEKLIDFIIPNGTAVQNARALFGDTITRDGFHLSYDFGRYIAGLTAFSKITGVSVDKVTYAPSTIDAKMIEIAKESVKKAIKNPYKVTTI